MKKLSFLTALLCASMISFAIDSEYCGTVMQQGTATEAAFTWETNDQGAVVITISETLGGAQDATHFRGNGINIDKIKVGESREDAANYFDLTCGSSSTITLSLKSGIVLAEGTKIYVTNQIIEYATSQDGNAWPTLTFEYTYGGVCSLEPELTRINFGAAAAFAQIGQGVELIVTPVDQMNRPMDVAVQFAVEPADAGSVVNNTYVPAKSGAATVTVSSGDISSSIVLYGVPSGNLALSQPCEAGYEPGNQAEISSKANDGDPNTQWVTYADQSSDVEWWIVDLGSKYSITAIDVIWGDPYSTGYILQVRDDAPSDTEKADDSAWETVSTQTGVTVNSEQFIQLSAAAGRYVRLHSLSKSANFFRLKEVRVFGTEYVNPDDTEAPVMTSATLDSKTWNSAILSVAATDNSEVSKYHVVDAAHQIDIRCIPSDGKITLSDLTPATAYNFTVSALDAANNESANSIVVAVTTDERHIVPTAAAPVPTKAATLVKSIYSDVYAFAPASLVGYNQTWWSEPAMTEEAIGNDHFLHYDLYRAGMIGAQFAELSVVSMEKMHIDVYASAAGTVTFRWIVAGDADALNGTKKTLELQAEQWNSFDFDLADFGAHNWARLFQFAIEGYEAGGLVGEHISVDNLYLYRETALVDNEAPTNVAASKVSESYFSVVLSASAQDNSGAVAFDVKNGETVVATGAGASGSDVSIVVEGLAPNTDYMFAVVAKDEAGNTAEAVSVTAKTAVAPAPAPAPDLQNKETVAVFCDALQNNPVINIGGWGQTTQAQVAELSVGDHVFFGTNFNYLGWELAPTVNATGMEYVHADFYATEVQTVQFTPISPGHEGVAQVTLTAGQWTSADIALSNYEPNNVDWSNIFQFKFMEATPSGKELFIDNVYFYKNTSGTSLEQTAESGVVTKMIQNGALYILRDGKTYNVQGMLVR